MSVALDNIWDEPIEETSTRSTNPSVTEGKGEEPENDSDDEDIFRPSKRRRPTALFLDDPDEDGDSGAALPASETVTSKNPNAGLASHPHAARPDIDALFDDLEDEPNPGPAKSGAPRGRGAGASSSSKPFDLTALRREAQARVERDAPPSSFPQYKVASSSPVRPGADALGPLGGSKGGKNDDDGAGKKRPVVKLDEDRLLGRDGLPALVQLCRGFTPRGKGHELADLNRLFSIYQFWAHKMYPKMQFSDVVNRVEKLCHSRRMHVALSVWRDELHGTINGKKVGVDGDADNVDGHSEHHDDDNGDVFGPRQANPSSSPSLRASSPPASRSQSSDGLSDAPTGPGPDGIGMDVDDDPFDLAAALFADERRPSKPATTFKTKPTPTAAEDEFPDEDEMWASVQAGAFEDSIPVSASASASASASTANKSNSNIGGGMHPGASAPSAGKQAPARASIQNQASSFVPEDDDDMWDLVDELEREDQQVSNTTAANGSGSGAGQADGVENAQTQNTSGAKNASSTVNADVNEDDNADRGAAAQPNANASVPDDDWDDMYV